MRKNKILLLTACCLFFILLLWGCGNGPGSPSSSGSEDTGIRIESVSVSRADGPDLDVYSDPTGCDGQPETLLTRKDATMTIQAVPLNENSSFDPFPASVEECKIIYKKAVEDPVSPVIESWTFYPNCTLDSGSNSCDVQLIDISRLMAYWDAITNSINFPAEYPTHYIAQYNCKYVNNYGDSGNFQTEYDIWLADFLVCGG